jgi:hypothetical protein
MSNTKNKNTMIIKNISIVEKQDWVCFNGNNNQLVTTFYKKYEVTYNNKTDIICYSSDGCRFEPYNGNFTEVEFERIKEELFDDAYYNGKFSVYLLNN